MTAAVGVASLILWRWRTRIRMIRAVAVAGIICLHLVMKAPVWYLLARIDLTGGSTGWHRAELITQALNHIGDWWIVGTDYTRNWLPTGSWWNPDHTDITNYFVNMGIIGGLPLLFCFIAIFAKAFQLAGRKMRILRVSSDPFEYQLWSVGAVLFAHCVTFLSISYFDQSYVLYCLPLGIVGALCGLESSNAVGKLGKVPRPKAAGILAREDLQSCGT